MIPLGTHIIENVIIAINMHLTHTKMEVSLFYHPQASRKKRTKILNSLRIQTTTLSV